MENTEDDRGSLRESAKQVEAARATSQPPPGAPSARERAGSSALSAYEWLARSARLADLVVITKKVVGAAAERRGVDPGTAETVTGAAEEARLGREAAETPFGNALDVLAVGPQSEGERALACALWAHAVAETPRERPDDEEKLARDLLWLAANTAFDATPLLDRALGEDAGDLWTSVADRVRRVARGRGASLARGEAVVGCAALAASRSPVAVKVRDDLAEELRDSTLLRVLAVGNAAVLGDVRLEGEIVAAPRGPVVTALLAFSGVLFVMHVVRLLARLALAYRRPAEISIMPTGVRVKTRIEMLGRTLREHEHVIVRSGLVRVIREVRYPRAGFYAGLVALALGSFIGVRSLVDGVRAASFSLLLAGLVVIAIGIGADFVLGSLLPGLRGRSRVAFVPMKGRPVCIGDVDAHRADEAIQRTLS